MKILFFNEDKELFNKMWHEYNNFHKSSFYYTYDWLEYLRFLRQNEIKKDLSFVIIKENKCVGICSLLINHENKIISFMPGEYSIAPLSENEKVERFIFKKIDEIAEENRIEIIKLFLDPLIMMEKLDFNIFLKYGFLNTSSTDCIVNLKKTKEELWRNLRKHYKSMINKVLKSSDFEFIQINKNNPIYDIHEIYRKLHHKCAGRVTREKKTFDKQFEMLKKGYATLIGLKYKNNFIGMQYFYHYQTGVIYASGVDDPTYTEQNFNIYHPILWYAQLYFKEKGFKYLEYSQPCGYSKVQGFDDYLDEKQLNISYFKRGMGGAMVSLYRGVKYYNKNLLLQDIEKFKEKI